MNLAFLSILDDTLTVEGLGRGDELKREKQKIEDFISVPLTKHAEYYKIALEGLKRARRFRKLHDIRSKKKRLSDADVDYLSQKNSEIEPAVDCGRRVLRAWARSVHQLLRQSINI